MLRTLVLAAGLFAATKGLAQQVIDCDWQSRADNLVEPWEANTRTFANGDVRVALLDTVEPAAAPFYLLVISPPFDELGLKQCRVIAQAENTGFYSIEFAMIEPGYDPARGLFLQMPAAIYNGEVPVAQMLEITINQSTGEIGVRMEPNPE